MAIFRGPDKRKPAPPLPPVRRTGPVPPDRSKMTPEQRVAQDEREMNARAARLKAGTSTTSDNPPPPRTYGVQDPTRPLEPWEQQRTGPPPRTYAPKTSLETPRGSRWGGLFGGSEPEPPLGCNGCTWRDGRINALQADAEHYKAIASQALADKVAMEKVLVTTKEELLHSQQDYFGLLHERGQIGQAKP